MTAMKAALDKALKVATRAKETKEIARADLVLVGWAFKHEKSTFDKMFRTALGRKADPRMKDPICLHVEHTYDEVSEGFILESRKCYYKGEAGFLCRLHDSLLLSKKKGHVAERDFRAEALDLVLKTEQRALTTIKREVIGGKFKITFEAGRRMKSDPDKVRFPEPLEVFNDV